MPKTNIINYAFKKSYYHRERIVIIGSGWSGYEIMRRIDRKVYKVTIVSPRNYFVFTPLLASTCVGTLEHRCVIEPIRRVDANVNYIQSKCISIGKNSIEVERLGMVPFDKLIIACGAVNNTYNVQGVKEFAHFLKDIDDARNIRQKILTSFEDSMQNNQSNLNFSIVGGGPTGVEFAAELQDFIVEDVSKIYPSLVSKSKITVYDVSKRILGTFDQRLADFTIQRFSRKGIQIETGISVDQVDKDSITLSDGRKIPSTMTLWATGLASNPLISNTKWLKKDKRNFRLLTDAHLRVYDNNNDDNNDDNESGLKVIDNIFAMGDCAVISKNDLPCTAQVAYQKARYLANTLNSCANTRTLVQGHPPFTYNDLGSMAYIGGWRAIVDLKVTKGKSIIQSGIFAWLFWRSAYLTMSVSWRNKILIPMYWFLTWIFGRDISRI